MAEFILQVKHMKKYSPFKIIMRVLTPRTLIHLLSIMLCISLFVSLFLPANRLTSDDLERWISEQSLRTNNSSKVLFSNLNHISDQSISGTWETKMAPITLNFIPSKSGKMDEYRVVFTIHFHARHLTSINRVATLDSGIVKFDKYVGDPITGTVFDTMALIILDGTIYLVPNTGLFSNIDSEGENILTDYYCFKHILEH